jgi:hypothetical protein
MTGVWCAGTGKALQPVHTAQAHLNLPPFEDGVVEGKSELNSVRLAKLKVRKAARARIVCQSRGSIRDACCVT